jgi:hypothetical protein
MSVFRTLDKGLDWGLHDAGLDGLSVDYVAAELVLVLRIKFGRHQETERRARVVVTGLVWAIIEPPCLDENGDLNDCDRRIDLVAGGLVAEPSMPLPKVPEGAFGQSIFVADWNAFIHVVGRHARLEWLEPEPTATDPHSQGLFPGEAIDGPRED